MALDDALHHILYLSRLAPGVDFSVVKDIVQSARARNVPLGITGALLFDGERFCQLLEGPGAAIDTLMATIEQDTRHTDIRMLHAGAADAGGRVLANWRSGYCEAATDLDVFDGPGALAGVAAVDAFVVLARAADLE